MGTSTNEALDQNKIDFTKLDEQAKEMCFCLSFQNGITWAGKPIKTLVDFFV